MILFVLLMWLLSSCGPGYHLKRRDYHERKAIEKGARVDADTTYKTLFVPVPIESVKTDTVFKSTLGDTVRIEKERLSIKYVQLPGEKVYIEGECKADTIIQKVEVPVTVTKKISAGYSLWEIIIFGIFVAVVAYILGMFRKKKSLG